MSTPHHDAALILDDYQRSLEHLPDSPPSDSGARAALMALLDDPTIGIALAIMAHTGRAPLSLPPAVEVEIMSAEACDDVRVRIYDELFFAASAIRRKSSTVNSW